MTETEDQAPSTQMVSELETLVSQLRDADSRGQKARSVTQRIEQIISELGSNPDYAALAQSEKLQEFVERLMEARSIGQDFKPGEIINPDSSVQVKKAWQWNDMSQFPTVTFVPNETVPVTWNGLRIYLVADQEVTVPRPHYETYMEHRRATRAAKEHAEYMTRQRDSVPSDPSMISPQTVRVRGMASGGHFVPGGGLIAEAATLEGEEKSESA